ncbi:MAG TPA: FlgD immunoglobulin-like domain containing protein [Candidatus Eisenbacteria bacterium]|jgi:hypothetical protein
MRSLETSPRPVLLLGSSLLLILGLIGCPTPAAASTAEVLTVGAVPAEPTICDPVTIGVTGALPSPCYQILSAEITGPVPPNPLCMGPVCPAQFEIRITVTQPSIPTPCPTVISPYRRSFPVGLLPAGAYSVRAVEVILPSDLASAKADSSVVFTLFFVRSVRTCPPAAGCYILSFGPAPERPAPGGFCTDVVSPGGTATFDLVLHNEASVAGLQTQVAIYDPRLDIGPYGPILGGMFTPKSVAAVGRAQGFDLKWSEDGGALKAILYSATGASIPPGEGAILRLQFDVAALTPPGTYWIAHFGEVVSDPEGTALEPCPTLRETGGRLCVVLPGCDVNGDGASDIRDIVRIVVCALVGGGTDACPDSIAARADCNGDGAIDVRDVVCCVRKVLAIRLEAPGTGVAGIPSPGAGPSISFLGDVEWLTPAEGRVRLRFTPGTGTAGIEWMMRPSAAVARPRELRIVSGGDGAHLEWSADEAGRAYAILYSDRGAPVGHDVVLELEVERMFGSSGPGSLHITDPLAAGSSGAPELAHSAKAAAAMSATDVSAPAVYPARPNPFVGESEVAFALPQAARAELRVYDVRGRLVRTLVNGPRPAGVYRERWDGRSDDGRPVATGIYLLRFHAGGVAQTQRLLRLR